LINQGQLSSNFFLSSQTAAQLIHFVSSFLCCRSNIRSRVLCCAWARIFTSKRPWLTDLELFECGANNQKIHGPGDFI
jgi:hypothetical protein